jgi:hypothetical protein
MKFNRNYSGGSLRTLLLQYSGDRSRVDPVFKAQFDSAQAEERRIATAKRLAYEARQAAKAAAAAATTEAV